MNPRGEAMSNLPDTVNYYAKSNPWMQAKQKSEVIVVEIDGKYVDLLIEDGHHDIENGVTISIAFGTTKEVPDCNVGEDVTRPLIWMLGWKWYREICNDFYRSER